MVFCSAIVVGARPSNSSDESRWVTDFSVSTERAGAVASVAAWLLLVELVGAQPTATQSKARTRFFIGLSAWIQEWRASWQSVRVRARARVRTPRQTKKGSRFRLPPSAK